MYDTMMANGLDFVLNSTEQLKIAGESEDEKVRARAYKYSLLHLSAGIELLMKSRLYIDNWTYIVADIDKIDRKKFEAGDFVSVDYAKCIERLNKLCGVEIIGDDKQALNDLKKIRNQVEHFMAKTSEAAIDSIINRALSTVLKFIKDNYEEFTTPSILDFRKDDFKGLTKTEKEYIDKMTTAINDIGNHHEEIVSLAIKRAEEYCHKDDIVICPDCKEKTLVINDSDAHRCHCYLCGYNANGEETATNIIENVFELDVYRTIKNGGEIPLYNCPECGNNSLIKLDNEYRCFSCRMRYNLRDIGFCDMCGELYCKYAREDIGMCENCMNYMNEKLEKE